MMHIGKRVVFIGELSSDEDLRFDGSLEGHIYIEDASLTLGETAMVAADIRAKEVIVQGTVRGSISARDRIELTRTAKVDGNLLAERVVIADGASFNGSIYMGRRTIARRVAQYRAAQAGSPG